MTIKERIKAFVLEQGNQVGAGAELAAILNDIVDSIPAAQVQSDYTQVDNTKPDFIKNKPALKTVATSGSYTDLTDKPTIPPAYTLPAASAETLGGVKVGSGLAITEEGVLRASGSGALIVIGSVSNNLFSPEDGQPSQEEARVAFESGRTVLLSYGDGDVLVQVIRRNADAGLEAYDSSNLITWPEE